MLVQGNSRPHCRAAERAGANQWKMFYLICHSFQYFHINLLDREKSGVSARCLVHIYLYPDNRSRECNACWATLLPKVCVCTVSISGLDPDSPGPRPWQSKIVAGNKDDELYSLRLFYSARAGGLGCLDQDQISILYVLYLHVPLCF